MAQRLLLALAAALAAAVVGLALFWHPGEEAATVQQAGGDFTLQSADGPVSLKDYRGKVVLLVFGYTNCPDICPTALTTTAAVLNLLKPEEAGRVAAFFVSVDPERDSAARLKEYVAFFHPRLLGLTGTPEQLAAVAQRYGVYFARHQSQSASGYAVDHSADTYLIGTDGVLIGRIPYATPPEQTAAEIRKHLS